MCCCFVIVIAVAVVAIFIFNSNYLRARSKQIFCNNLLFINNNKNFGVFCLLHPFRIFKRSFPFIQSNRKEFRYPVATPDNWGRFQRLCCNQSYENSTALGSSINEFTCAHPQYDWWQFVTGSKTAKKSFKFTCSKLFMEVNLKNK